MASSSSDGQQAAPQVPDEPGFELQGGYLGALKKTGHVLSALATCLAELAAVEEMVDSDVDRLKVVQNADLLRLVVNMRDTVGNVIVDAPGALGRQGSLETLEGVLAQVGTSKLTSMNEQDSEKNLVVSIMEIGSAIQTAALDDRVTTCGHSFGQHLEVVDSSVWGKLPEQLLELIFALLPVPEIYRLRCLSRGRRSALLTNSTLTRLCAEYEPNLVQLLVDRESKQYKVIVVGPESYDGRLAGEFYDSDTGVWTTLDSGDIFVTKFHYYLEVKTQSLVMYDCARKKNL